MLNIPVVGRFGDTGNNARENRADEERRYEWDFADQPERRSLETAERASRGALIISRINVTCGEA